MDGINRSQAAQEIARLTALITYHNRLYYEEARTEISDYEFDQLLAQLITLEKNFPDLSLPHSPTKNVGGFNTKNFATVYHHYPMLSLSNTYSSIEVDQFMQRMRKQFVGQPVAYFCELKLDGIAVSLHYKTGKLITVTTRGDGNKGDDITENAKAIPSIPHQIQADNIPDFFEVRGEIIMPLATFDQLNQERYTKGQELLANPRNATAGAIKTIKKHAGLQYLSLYCYTLAADEMIFTTQEDCINELTRIGFKVPPASKKCTSLQEVVAYIGHWETARKELPVATDGIVIKINNLYQQQQLGNTAKSPRWAIAYKYKPEYTSTILLDVSYQVGRTGVVTPVANLKPILLSGTIVKRATLHNAPEIQRLGLHYGDTIFIEKSGEIIPKIIGVDLSKRTTDSRPIVFIKTCPACDTTLTQKCENALTYCPNTSKCPCQLQGLLNHFVSRDALDIRTMGKKTIKQLVQQHIVHGLVDFYSLRYEDIKQLEGFQETSINQLLEGIKNSKKRPFDRVLFGLGIRHIGTVTAKKLAEHYGSIENLISAPLEELLKVPHVGPEIAYSVLNYFQDLENTQLIEGLKKAGLQLSMPTIKPLKKEALPLNGKKILLSGTFENFEREEFKDFIQRHGGTVVSHISQKLNYVVAGKNPGPSKIEKATQLDIDIIDEKSVLKMISG